VNFVVKGINISVYVDNETLKWLDQLCGEWGLTRGKAISMVLKESRKVAGILVAQLETLNPDLAKKLKKRLKDSI